MNFSMDDMCKAGCTTPRGVRHWEDEGLLGSVQRTAGNTRRFTQDQIDKARIIAASKFGGWSIDETKSMISEWGDEVREAIMSRLTLQIEIAGKMASSLPRCETEMEFDL